MKNLFNYATKELSQDAFLWTELKKWIDEYVLIASNYDKVIN